MKNARVNALVGLTVAIALLVGISVTGFASEGSTRSYTHGLASLIIPGFGQLLNDQPGKGFLHLVVAIALPVACYMATYNLRFPYPTGYLCALVSVGWAVVSAFDAYEVAGQNFLGFSQERPLWDATV